MTVHDIAGFNIERDWDRFTEASQWIVDGKSVNDLEFFLVLEREILSLRAKVNELNLHLQASEQ